EQSRRPRAGYHPSDGVWVNGPGGDRTAQAVDLTQTTAGNRFRSLTAFWVGQRLPKLLRSHSSIACQNHSRPRPERSTNTSSRTRATDATPLTVSQAQRSY